MSNKEHKIEYRVVRQSKDGDEWLSMQEVYFDGDDKAYAHTDMRMQFMLNIALTSNRLSTKTRSTKKG